MTTNDIATTAMWDSAVTDTDAVARRSLVVRAKVALAGAQPFLQAASSEEDFHHRLALMQDQIVQQVPREVLDEVVASLQADWQIVHTARLEATAMRREAAFKIALVEGQEALPQAYVHVHKHAGDSADDSVYQVDHIASPTFLQTVGHFGDHDEAMQKAREFGLPHGLPIYENGKFVEARLRQLFAPDEEFFDAKTGKWIPARALGNETASGPRPFEAAYQPDPDAAWRYHAYPPPQPQAGQGGQPTADGQQGVAYPIGGAAIGPDGFPLDVSEGEQRSQEAYQRQLTPGAWTVTPGTEWPTRPNAGSFDQTPVFASYYDRNKPSHYHHPDGPEMYDKGYQHGHAGRNAVYTGHEDYLVGHRDGESDRQVENQFGYPTSQQMASRKVIAGVDVAGWDQASIDKLLRGMASFDKMATEGIAPTPGPNPNYFSQGTQGLQGPSQFPENPSGSIEPKTDNRVDDLYGGVPPETSSGSASDGSVDGGGYSRQGVTGAKQKFAPGYPHMTVHPAQDFGGFDLHDVGWHESPTDHFNVGAWPSATVNDKAASYGRGYMRAHGHGAVDVPIHHVAEPSPYWGKTSARSRDFSRSAGERTAGYSDDYEEGREHGQAGLEHNDVYSQPTRGYLSGWEQGQYERGEMHPDDREYAERKYRTASITLPDGTQSFSRLVGYWDKSAATNGRIVGLCDHCGQAVRYHSEGGGHLRHLHNSSPKCNDAGQVTASNRQWLWVAAALHTDAVALYDRLPQFVEAKTADLQVIPLQNGGQSCVSCQNHATHRVRTESGRDVGPVCTMHAEQAQRNGRIGSRHTAADLFRAIPHDQPHGECEMCGRSATHDLAIGSNGGRLEPIAKVCPQHASEYDSRHVAKQGAVLENPSADNPTGRGGDPYRSKTTWEGFEHQRPRQQMEGDGGMNANTPTTAPDPIRTGPNANSPLPGGSLDDDGPRERDDDEEED